MRNFPDRETVERIRREYPAGTRIALIAMDDVQAPPIGTKGTVRYMPKRRAARQARTKSGGSNAISRMAYPGIAPCSATAKKTAS